MKKITMNFMKLAFVASLVVLYSCGGTTEPATETTDDGANVEETTPTDQDAVNEDAQTEENTETAELDLTTGKEVYAKCIACHQENGEGVEGSFPPLANSDYLLADKNRAIKDILNGLEGDITVNGTTYGTIAMTANVLTDEETVDVMNYILNSWGNEGGTITLEDVAAAKE